MENMTFCVPCLFGLEGLVGDELKRLDLQNVRVEDRRVSVLMGDKAAPRRQWIEDNVKFTLEETTAF